MDIKQILKNTPKERYFSKVNLHIHSNISDGICDFDKIVEDAISLNMDYIAICDHNSVLGYNNSKYKNHPILIPAVEFDCRLGFSLIHIVGLGIDTDNIELNKICAKNPKGAKNDLYRLFKSRHPKTAIDAIHKAGGIAVFAHPCCTNTINLDKFTKKLVDLEIDAIEVYYPYERLRAVVKFSSRKEVTKIADKYNLLYSGGSDEHGYLIKERVK